MNKQAILAWVKSIISGVGGLQDLYDYEYAVDNFPHDEAVALWAIKCLANPRCAGSKEVLAEILTAYEGEHDVDYLISKIVYYLISKIDDYVMSGQVSTKEALLAIADFSNWLDKED